jgi:membrane protein YqaA with SNARE-associated domain
VQEFFFELFRYLARLGGPGLFGMALLDSSFLFMPVAMDLLMVAFTARNPGLVAYYVAMATAGSVVGTLLIDAPSRKLGEAGLEGRVPEKKLARIRRRFEKHAFATLILSSLIPPPFPAKVVVIVAAGLQYCRKRLIAAIAIGRLLRFAILGLLAMHYGTQILRMSEHPAVRWIVIGITLLSIIGSVISVWMALRKRRGDKGRDRLPPLEPATETGSSSHSE